MSVALRFVGAAVAGVLAAGLMILVLGRPTPPATISGTVAGARSGTTVVVLASRNACAQTGRRPLALAWTEVEGDEFSISIPHVGPGVAYVCAYERRPGVHVQGPYERWDQVRLPVRGEGGMSHSDVALTLRPGLPVFTDGRGRR
ncbi:MAG: hypothetical protein KDA24_24640 [Deltaproteobacteria bacterium]|nr:hypothetical protein [Deltaproteobacteria bacterium]